MYASESIAPGVRNSPLVIGLLIVQRREAHLTALAAIRSKTGYKRQVRYRSTDEYKVGCAREFVRYFAQTPDLRFVAKVVRSSSGMTDALRASEYPQVFRVAELPAGVALRLKHRQRSWGYGRGRGSGQTELQARIAALKSSGLISGSQIISRNDKDALVELSNLLTGSLFGSVSGVTGRQSPSQDAPRKSAIKSSVTERLRAVLRVKDLTTAVKGKWDVRIENRGALAESLSGIEQQLYENERSDVRL